jgi:hypothetical protein
MKKLILFIAIICFANDTKEVLELIKILQHQKITYKPITNIYNPFYNPKIIKQAKNNFFIPISTKTEKTKYNLEIIFQNKARINGKWYKNGDKLNKYKVVITNNKVFLKHKNKIIYLNRKTILKVTK